MRRTPSCSAKVRARWSNYFIQEEVFARGQRIPVPRQSVKAGRPTIITFADDAPLANWAHACRYLLHDAESGELYREVPARFPPYAGERDRPRTFKAFHEPIQFAPQDLYRLKPLRPLRPRWGGSRYALLFSGMSNNRHTNDLEFLYRALRDVHSYAAKNIIVLNHDGTLNYDGNPKPVTAWPGDSTAYRMPVDGKGSRTDLLAALDSLKKRLKPDDSLLIHTNNHGGHNGIESDLCCFPNWDSLGVKDFTDKLAELPNFRCLMVMMEQCHSGGFNSAVVGKSTAAYTSIAAACEELENSIGGSHFDPFARDWIAAVADADPYGAALDHDPDANSDGRVSAREAFEYADSIHDPYDTPVFSEGAAGGGHCWLGKDLILRLPPLLREQLIRKIWPEPDPAVIEERVRRVLPQLEQLEADVAPRLEALQHEYEQRASEILRSARRG